MDPSHPKIQPKSKPKLKFDLSDPPPPPPRSYGSGEGRIIDYPPYQPPYQTPYQTSYLPPYQTPYQTSYLPPYQSRGIDYPSSQSSYNPYHGYAYGDIRYGGGGYRGGDSDSEDDDGSYAGKGRRLNSHPPFLPFLPLPRPPTPPPPPILPVLHPSPPPPPILPVLPPSPPPPRSYGSSEGRIIDYPPYQPPYQTPYQTSYLPPYQSRGIDYPSSQPSYNPYRGYAYGNIRYGGGSGGGYGGGGKDSDSDDDGGSYADKGRRLDSHPPPPPPPILPVLHPSAPPPPPRSFKKEDIIVDPDGGSSSLCSGCRLPIFSTPSISIFEGGEQLFMHDQCTRLPEILVHELHSHHTLALLNQPQNSTITCHNCNQICGTLLYQCVDPSCDFRLDLLCSMQIRIVHRSHHHSMQAIRQRESSSLTCGACDTKHESEEETETETATISYLCNLCGFWIHPDCASLPNAILHYEEHKHSLFLTYNIIPSAADYSKCVICERVPKRSSGVYFCLKCPNYVVHIRCALTRPKSFKPVFIRDAQVADLGRLPMPDDQTNIIPYIRENTSAIAVIDDHYQSNLHSHPLILHKTDEGDQSISRVCNVCVQSISSPPFFSCSHCPDFSLHHCCADLPTEIEHPIHRHSLSLSSKAPKSDISGSFYCKGCHIRCNGFAYSCSKCNDMSLDVVCALITPTITHESHNKTHILFMSRNMDFSSDQICNCCKSVLNGICYECSICRNFKLHVRCALLPTTVSHAFDKHPLQLTSNTTIISTAAAAAANNDEANEFCEVCEEHLEKRHWYYSCSECDQSFHVDCIPSVDLLSRIKLGSTVRVDGHGCSVTLIRERDAVCGGLRCGFCGEMFKFSSNGLVYECSDCYFGIHYGCAEKCLVKS